MNRNELIFQQSTLQWVFDMLLCNKIRLAEVPAEIRKCGGDKIYTGGFRASVSEEMYLENLNILLGDILDDDSYSDKESLIRTLGDYTSKIYVSETITEEFLNDFRRKLPEKVLQEMYRGFGITADNIRAKLEKQGII